MRGQSEGNDFYVYIRAELGNLNWYFDCFIKHVTIRNKQNKRNVAEEIVFLGTGLVGSYKMQSYG